MPARSVNQVLMALWERGVTSQKLSFWFTWSFLRPLSVRVLHLNFSAIMLLKFELI